MHSSDSVSVFAKYLKKVMDFDEFFLERWSGLSENRRSPQIIWGELSCSALPAAKRFFCYFQEENSE